MEDHCAALCLCLAALHWLWVPVRGPGPAGGHRQRLRVPAGALPPAPQLPQPRVLPRQTHVQRGKCAPCSPHFAPGLGQLQSWGSLFLARFPLWVPAGGVPVWDLIAQKGLCCRFGVSKEEVVQEQPPSPSPAAQIHTNPGDAPCSSLCPPRGTPGPAQGGRAVKSLPGWEFNLSRAGTL